MATKVDGGGEEEDMDSEDWTMIGKGKGRGKEKGLKQDRGLGK